MIGEYRQGIIRTLDSMAGIGEIGKIKAGLEDKEM